MLVFVAAVGISFEFGQLSKIYVGVFLRLAMAKWINEEEFFHKPVIVVFVVPFILANFAS